MVSDGGAVELGPWLAPFVELLRLRYIVAPHGGPASARNHGLAAARGDIVAFIDDVAGRALVGSSPSLPVSPCRRRARRAARRATGSGRTRMRR